MNDKEQKNECLIKLIALKAALIGERGYADTICDVYSSTRDRSSSINDKLNKQISELEKSKLSDENIIQAYLEDKTEKYDEMQKVNNKRKKNYDAVLLIGAIVIIVVSLGVLTYLFGFGIIPTFIGEKYFEGKELADCVTDGLVQATVVALIESVVLIIACRVLVRKVGAKLNSRTNKIDNKKEDWINKYKETDEYKEDIKVLIKRNEPQNSVIDLDIADLKTECNKNCEAERQRVQTQEKKLENMLTAIKKDMSALGNRYESVLPKLEWENLDYIIWLFAFDYVNNVSVALRKVNEEKVNRHINEDLSRSAEYLSKNFRMLVEKLGEPLDKELQELNVHYSLIYTLESDKSKKVMDAITKVLSGDYSRKNDCYRNLFLRM